MKIILPVIKFIDHRSVYMVLSKPIDAHLHTTNKRVTQLGVKYVLYLFLLYIIIPTITTVCHL